MSKVKQAVSEPGFAQMSGSAGLQNRLLTTLSSCLLPERSCPTSLCSLGAHFPASEICQAHLPTPCSQPAVCPQCQDMPQSFSICVNLSQVQLLFCGHGGNTPQKVKCVLQNVKISLCDLVPSRKVPASKEKKNAKHLFI